MSTWADLKNYDRIYQPMAKSTFFPELQTVFKPSLKCLIFNRWFSKFLFQLKIRNSDVVVVYYLSVELKSISLKKTEVL